MKYQHALFAAVAAVSVPVLSARAAVDGTVGAGEYGLTLATQTNTTGFGHWFHPNTPDSGHYIGGDSGSPTFMLWDGQLTILGAHSGVDSDPDNNPLTLDQYNVDSFLPFYVDQINALIQASGFQISILTPVPEPGTLTLIGLAGAGLYFGRWRRRVVA